MSLLDDFSSWISVGPGAPYVSIPFTGTPTKFLDFGETEGSEIVDHIQVRVSGPSTLVAPANGLLRRFPDWTTLTAEGRDLVRRAWPALRRHDGTPFAPPTTATDTTRLESYDLLLEMWGTAHRRLEFAYASTGIFLPTDDEERPLPRQPVPRYFVFRGVQPEEMAAAIDNLLADQFSTVPTISKFLAGHGQIFVPADDAIASFTAAKVLSIWAFDADGQVIDPIAVFGMFAKIAQLEELQRFAKPTHTELLARHAAWSTEFPPRHTIVVSEPRGHAHVAFVDPPPSGPPGPPPDRLLTIVPEDGSPFDVTVPPSGIIRMTSPAQYGAVNDGMATLSLSGEHTRILLHPHGAVTDDGPRPEFVAGSSFHRVRVLDLARWFPLNANPINQLSRYTEKNDYTPLVDAQDAFREVYRAIRSTHVEDEYPELWSLPVGTPKPPPAPGAPSRRIYEIGCWLHPSTPLMGERAMLPTRRTQEEGYRPPDNLAQRLSAIPLARFEDDPAPEPSTFWDYYLISLPAVLAPGSWVEISQTELSIAVSGDNPWLAGHDFGRDIFGLRAIMDRDDNPRSWSFVGSQGQFALKARTDPAWTMTADLRVVTWSPIPADANPEDIYRAGHGLEHQHVYGQVVLPSAGVAVTDGLDRARRVEFLWTGNTGDGVVRVPAGFVTADARTCFALNARTGEWVSASVAVGDAAVDMLVMELAHGDRIVFAVALAGATDPSMASVCFELEPVAAQIDEAAVPRHRTQLSGALRDAIQGGVDVRVLGWYDTLQGPESRAERTLAVQKIVNATLDGRRGQALVDTLARESAVHHQKAIFANVGTDPVAFLGGVDLANGRYDDHTHRGIHPDRRGGLWHDLHCMIRGPAVWDVYTNFMERWNAAAGNPDVIGGTDPGITDVTMPPQSEIDQTPQVGRHAVQINRTIPSHVQAYDGFVDPELGDRSIKTSLHRMIAEARDLIYLEEQYLWDPGLGAALNNRLCAQRSLRLILVIPALLDEAPVVDLMLYTVRRGVINTILYGIHDYDPAVHGPPDTLASNASNQVAILHLENERNQPVYVHCKTWIVDDVWMSIGSANATQRSLTYDSEIAAACVDTALSRGGHRTARELRVALLAEHLGLRPEERPLVEDPRDAFEYVRSVLAGRTPRRRDSHLRAFDPNRTQYDLQPPDLDPYYQEGIDEAIDTNGDERDRFPVAGLKMLLDLLAQSDASAPLTTTSAIRVTITFDPIAFPGERAVSIDVIETGASGPPTTFGPYPVISGQAFNAGFALQGTSFTITAHLAAPSDPTIVASGTAIVTPVTSLAQVTIETV
jgi:phosphatidylserine/phosphatidylglycerophosphate/cardiolipin synthase-like enzyme